MTTTWPERIVTTELSSCTATTGICETTVLFEAIATAGSSTRATTRVTVGRSARLISSVARLIAGWTVRMTPIGTVRISLLMLT